MKHIFQAEIGVVGGDSRQLAVAETLVKLGARVKVFGHSQASLITGMEIAADLTPVFTGVDAIILPISGLDEQGRVRGAQLEQKIDIGPYLTNLPEQTVLITGSLTHKWQEIVAKRSLKVYSYAEDDRIAILNSVPTAEGAVQLAMESLPITIHRSRVLVVGFGRVGVAVARIFKALEAKVTVAARRRELLARAWEMGCETVYHNELKNVVTDVDLVITSVPFVVIDRELLSLMSSDTLVIDLASPPGGTDFRAATELGVHAILASGLPGKVAPKTAGAILATAIPEILEKLLADGGDR